MTCWGFISESGTVFADVARSSAPLVTSELIGRSLPELGWTSAEPFTEFTRESLDSFQAI